MNCGIQLENLKPNVSFGLCVGKYLVKVAETPDEFKQTFALRRAVFFGEDALDFNEFDKDADLIIVKAGEEIVGTYRVRCSRFTQNFYASSVFYTEDLFAKFGKAPHAELSRACIKPGKRQGVVILALWRGILAYFEKVGGIDYLLGCVSIFSRDPLVGLGIFEHLKRKGYCLPGDLLKAKAKLEVSQSEILDCSPPLPPLFDSYLRMGTKVYSEPAVDKKLGTFDFLCVLRLSELDPFYSRKFS